MSHLAVGLNALRPSFPSSPYTPLGKMTETTHYGPVKKERAMSLTSVSFICKCSFLSTSLSQ